jgi:hypothetical protein
VLVASGLLSGLGQMGLATFLFGTYLMWGAGLRANLAANWTLLSETGTSTNVLSKAAHDLARVRTGSIPIRRAAGSLGYLLCELAKEAPYYAGASGAALASEGISAVEAIVFLGGANLGAAAYEYALARATGAFLRGRSRAGRSS